MLAAKGRLAMAKIIPTPDGRPTRPPQWHQAKLDRKVLKGLMQKTDTYGLVDFGLWIVLLLGSGGLAVATWGTWWALPAFLLYGTIWSSADARWHECGHATVFKTRWLNELFYHVSSYMTLREAHLWRWSHVRHHTHTVIKGRDPEIQVRRPADLFAIAIDFFHLKGGPAELQKIFSHAMGRIDDEVKDYVPVSERPKMVRTSRIYVAIIVGCTVWSIAAWTPLPLLLFVLPRFYGGWLHQLLGLTQHAGLAEDVDDHRLNTRTVLINPVFRYLYLNMNYHLEHHMYPMVPYHRLPELHRLIKDQLPPAYPSLWAAYQEIVPALLRQAKDPGYHVVRELPERARAAA
jgi:fatty acid desaturase